MEFPVLQTSRLDLIEINQNHLNDFFEIFSDPEVARYYNLKPFTYLEEGAKYIDMYNEYFHSRKCIRWGIALKNAKQIMGTIGFNNFTENHRANIGYDLKQKYWNNGYVTEALRAILDYGFGTLKVNRIEAEVLPENIASEKVLLKTGFTKEALLRQWIYWNKKHFNVNMFSILREEY